MLNIRAQYLLWQRQVFVRNPNDELNGIYSRVSNTTGIYLIGCADEIVYVGQSWKLRERPLESLGRIYHRVLDTSLPWSLALAPCPAEEMDERESTAIRTFAPKYNTSIPSISKSEGRMPDIIGHAAVFQNQIGSGGAFDDDSLQRQMERARTDAAPSWRMKTQRARRVKHVTSSALSSLAPPVQLTGEDLKDSWRRYGVSLSGPLTYPINLCDDGCVLTRDGEDIGTWSMDQYGSFSFTPNGATSPLTEAPLVGLLCMSIRAWQDGEHQ